jgi:uncharacterized protein (DUF433 family)
MMVDRITINQKVFGGKACIRGMRISVENIIDMLMAGATGQKILDDYPYLEREDLVAAVDYMQARINYCRSRIDSQEQNQKET